MALKSSKSLTDKWNQLVEKNKKQWAKDLYELIKKGQYWDVSFDRYSKYRVFCIHFKREIYKVFDIAKKEFPDLDITVEDVSHDLYLSMTEDDSAIKEIEEKIESVINNIPKA